MSTHEKNLAAAANTDVANEAIKRFSCNYEYLYNNPDLPGCITSALVYAGDYIMGKYPDVLEIFCKAYGDLVTSDREVAAFALTFPWLIA